MTDQLSDAGANTLLLTTERQVFAFNLMEKSRVTIGRHASNDLQLESRTVSNFHAEIVCEEGELTLRDLGSTNGSYVGRRRVDVQAIHKGDEVRVGNHLIAVDLKPADGNQPALRSVAGPMIDADGRGKLISTRARGTDAMQTALGASINDLTATDLITRMVTNPQALRALVRRDREVARIWSADSKIVHAEFGKVVGEKALYRVFAWPDGDYEIEGVDPNDPLPQTISLPVDALVMEGMAHGAELGKLVARLPPMQAPLRLKEDCPLPITSHSPAEIEVFRSIIQHETIAATLESTTVADVRVLRLIESLLEKGVFEAEAGFDEELKGTLFPARAGRTA